ncbi:MAG TPA: oligosaccharide flippase family protein [Terriglobia bacterium]|nr:oligosaccharide flippase family protein [Terriglobia bacterium]
MVVRNVFSNWVGMVVLGVVSFLMTPVLIHGLGDFQFGMWALVVSLVDYYGLLDVGMRVALLRFVARYKGGNDRAALNELLKAALVLVGIAGLVICVLTAILTVVLPGFLHVAGMSVQLFRWLIILMGLSMLLILPARLMGTYLIGLQRFDLYNLGAVSVTVVRALLMLVVLRLGYGLLGVAAVSLVMDLVSLALHWHLVRWADPEVVVSIGRVNWKHLRELVGFGFYAYLSYAGDYLRFQTDSIVIARVLAVALVTPFAAAGRLMNYFRTVIYGLTGALLPRMSELDGQSNERELQAIFLLGTKATTLISLLIGSLLVLNGKSLLHLWLGERFVDSYGLLMALTAGYVGAMALWPSREVLYARGRHQALGYWTLTEGVANLLLSIYWGRKYGLIGVALGTTVPMLLTGLFFQPWYALRILRLRFRDYFRQALAGPLLGTALFLAAAFLVPEGLFPKGMGGFLATVACESALFALMAYVVGLSGKERQRARKSTARLLAPLVGANLLVD